MRFLSIILLALFIVSILLNTVKTEDEVFEIRCFDDEIEVNVHFSFWSILLVSLVKRIE